MYNSIFQKKWWLDAVAHEKWHTIEIKNGDEIIARMPIVLEKKYGIIKIIQPPLTQTLGPWITVHNGKYANQLAFEKKVLNQLIGQLPKFDIFNVSFNYTFKNCIPFHWHGFKQNIKYTYVIDDLSNENIIWDGFLDNIRTDIRKAENRYALKIVTDLSIDIFLDVNEKTFNRQGKKLPYTREFIRNFDLACMQNKSRKIFFAIDNFDNVHAAVYIVWDEISAYCLMVGGDPEFRNSGATSLCIWHAIKFSSTVTKKFDFEGSMLESVEKYYRAFGAKQYAYSTISKNNTFKSKLIEVLSLIKNIFI
jgi:hypothetical protein